MLLYTLGLFAHLANTLVQKMHLCIKIYTRTNEYLHAHINIHICLEKIKSKFLGTTLCTYIFFYARHHVYAFSGVEIFEKYRHKSHYSDN